MPLPTMLWQFSKNVQNHTTVSVHSYNSHVGKIYRAADDDFLYIVTFEGSKGFEKSFQILSEKLKCDFVENKNKILNMLEDELDSYFKGTLKKFSLPIKIFGLEFHQLLTLQLVWDKLQELSYGSTQTYGDLACALGRAPSHARAIGSACGANSHLLVIPCHRLVASGSKGGFSCGVDRKEWLIDHEKKHAT